MAAVITACCTDYAGKELYGSRVYAWWGTIYPEFCFEEGEEEEETKPVKVSFWLAKALDW